MFGYVKIYKPDLKVAEYETYRSIYCGLCRQLGKDYGALARMTLSFDFTFLSTLMMALEEERPVYSQRTCPANPLKRCLMADLETVQSRCCDCTVLVLYFTMMDDLHDKGARNRLRAAALYPAVSHAHKKAAERQPEIERIIAEGTARQSAIEAKETVLVDEACEPTANMMAAMLASLSDDPIQKRVLERLGYLTGRYVYLCDALDDLEDDREKGNFNPFLAGGQVDTGGISTAIGSLYLTIAEAAKTFELLEFRRFESILANIFYLGMKDTVDTIAKKKEKTI